MWTKYSEAYKITVPTWSKFWFPLLLSHMNLGSSKHNLYIQLLFLAGKSIWFSLLMCEDWKLEIQFHGLVKC
jgi:hypothetical protein